MRLRSWRSCAQRQAGDLAVRLAIWTMHDPEPGHEVERLGAESSFPQAPNTVALGVDGDPHYGTELNGRLRRRASSSGCCCVLRREIRG